MLTPKKDDLVRHPHRPEWGIGRIINIDVNGVATVTFTKYGMATLHLGKVGWKLTRLENSKEALIQYHKEFLEDRGLPYSGIHIRSSDYKKRETGCYACKGTLNSEVNIECIACGWILCRCGACGCGHSEYGPKIKAQRNRNTSHSMETTSEPPVSTKSNIFDSFDAAKSFAKNNPGSHIVRSDKNTWRVILKIA